MSPPHWYISNYFFGTGNKKQNETGNWSNMSNRSTKGEWSRLDRRLKRRKRSAPNMAKRSNFQIPPSSAARGYSACVQKSMPLEFSFEDIFLDIKTRVVFKNQ